MRPAFYRSIGGSRSVMFIFSSTDTMGGTTNPDSLLHWFYQPRNACDADPVSNA